MAEIDQWPGKVPPWPANFPLLLVHNTLAGLYAGGATPNERFLKGRSAAYLAAKAGDVDSAARVVEEALDLDKVIQIGEKYPGCVVAAVHAEEDEGRNKLPTVFAAAIAEICDFDLDVEIIQINRVSHTLANARQRLARVPLFAGEVLPNRQYVIVDDVCTTGSSLAALRHYIEARGSQVVVASALAIPDPEEGRDSRQLAITEKTAGQIRRKFNSQVVDDMLKHYGIAPSIGHLTEAAGKTILGFQSALGLRASLSASR